MFDFEFDGQPLQFFGTSGSNTTSKIMAFYRGLTRICTPVQDGYPNSKVIY